MSEPIRGGYYLKARCIDDSEVAHMPPHTREIWDYLLRKAFWQDGKRLKRGELLTSCPEIQNALHWKIGWRKATYSLTQCENSMKALRNAGMITTRNAERGVVVSICNYWRFQDPDSYECRTDYRAERRDDCRPNAESKDEEENKKEEGIGSTPAPDGFPHDLFERFKSAHTDCLRVKDFEFQRALAACPGCDVAEAVEAFERQLAGAGSIRFPVREFEKYLRRSCGKKDGSRGFPQKNAAQTLADEEATRAAISARLMDRPEGEESQAERLKRLAEERARKQHKTENED
ncbi:hypothetical protein P4C99_07620 [Pontiellaceae bacterium B1224]|nr:hypothetical protein [Pontiellaceae bacterium B1224]